MTTIKYACILIVVSSITTFYGVNMRKAKGMVKRILIVSMAVLFCFSISMTGCGAGTAGIQSEKNPEQVDSAASSGTAISEISSGDESPATEASDELSDAVSSETTSSQASSAVDVSPVAETSAETSKATSSETTDKQAPSASSSEQSSETMKYDYFLAGSFNGYVANDVNFQLQLIPGSKTWYAYTVTLTEDNRDALYDGHWYKVTTGDWNAPSYGNDNYCIKNPPVKRLDDGTAIGLGSIWVDENVELTVIFDSTNKIVYDNANGKSLPTP